MELSQKSKLVLEKIKNGIDLVGEDLIHVSLSELEKHGILERKSTGVYSITPYGENMLLDESNEGKETDNGDYQEVKIEKLNKYRLILRIKATQEGIFSIKSNIEEYLKEKEFEDQSWNLAIEQKLGS
jgi:hypothetical protein